MHFSTSTSIERGKEDDAWVSSICAFCYNHCGIRAHRVNGRVVKIEGDPKNYYGQGRICAKGLAGINLLYDPNRLNYPMKRTNPEKGVGIDPKWKRISWDAALDEVAEKLRDVRKTDPRKLILGTAVVNHTGLNIGWPWSVAYGSPNIFFPNGNHCGNAEHVLADVVHAGLTTNADLIYTNYLMLFGTHLGTAAYYSFTTTAQRLADARARGLKLMVFDPVMNAAAEKADEWIPLRPGTDGAVACAILNVLLNELSIYDVEHLKLKTNAPYLIDPYGHYVRDIKSKKPLVWDPVDSKAKVYNDHSIKDYALAGRYEVHDTPCKPSFELLRERVKEFPPEKASSISAIPATTLRRIAKEWGKEARIGSTIAIEGQTLPYRPVAAVFFKGAHGHSNAWMTSLAISSLNEVVGSNNAVGGLIAPGPVSFGHPETQMPRKIPREGVDGLVDSDFFIGQSSPGMIPSLHPPPEPSGPLSMNLLDTVPTGISSLMPVLVALDPKKYGVPYEPEIYFHQGGNILFSVNDPRLVEKFLQKLYVANFCIYLNETSLLSDLVLPDACYLERLDPLNLMFSHNMPVGLGWWSYMIRQPVIPAMYERRNFAEVLFELSERIGMREDFYKILNMFYGLGGTKWALEPDRKLGYEELCGHILKAYFGEEHGLEWFKGNGPITWPMKVNEVYWPEFYKARVPLYFEWMVTQRKKTDEILEERKITGFDTSHFDPMPNWKPCTVYGTKRPEYDLWAVYYRVAWHSFGWTNQLPWLNELSTVVDPVGYDVMMNTKTAAQKRINDMDIIEIQSSDTGVKVQARVKLSEGIHPEVIAIAGNSGHYSPYLPIARGKGFNFESLLALDHQHTDLPSMTVCCDAKVKVTKA